MIGSSGSGLPAQDVFASAFSSQTVAERCDKISIDQKSNGLLNYIIRGFLLKGLVQSSYGNAETASFGVFFMKIAQNFLGQTLNLDHYMSRSSEDTVPRLHYISLLCKQCSGYLSLLSPVTRPFHTTATDHTQERTVSSLA